ncbi:MFS transporter [Streptomyces sp.]|uniref:MFS transporter n=1 Tax=Streptomyces sp. TaxID=1931 RepID=UPI002F41F5B2
MSESSVRPGPDRAPAHPAEAGAGVRAPSKALALVLIATAQMMVVLDVSVVNVALPSIQRSVGFSATGLEWVVNAYAIAFGGLLLLGGRVADAFGQRRIFVIGAALLTAASLFGGLATGQAWLLTARAVQGVAGALLAPAALALLTTTFSEGSERNRAMGVYGAVSGMGGALGNVLGGVFTDTLGWRWVLFVNVPIGLAVALAAPLAFRETRRAAGRLDLPGATAVTAGMSLVVYGLVHATSHPWGSAGTVTPLAAGGALLVAFLLIQARSRSPLMPLGILADRNRSGAYLIILVLGAALIALFYFLTLFLQNILAFSPMRTGFAFLAFAVGVMVAATAGGKALGRTGVRPPLAVGTLVSAAGLFWLARIDVHSGYFADLFGPLLVTGAGMGLCFVPLAVAAMSRVRPQEAGVSSALLSAGQQLGGALGLAVLGTVAASATRDRLASASAHHAGASPVRLAQQAMTHGYSTAFQIAGWVLVAAFLVSVTAVSMSAEDTAAAGSTVPV